MDTRLISPFRILLIIFSMCCVQVAIAEALENQLADHPSPYLALHGQDPLAWQQWDVSVLQRARQEDKLIFLSIGYFTCHWCHVMQRESFQDPEVADWVNRHFIPVKIDRELEEALDARMIAFAEETRGRAGWPLNVFLTPEGYPLYAELYLPRDNFLEFIKRLQDLWASDPDGLRELVNREAGAGKIRAVHAWQPDEIDELFKLTVSQALSNADTLNGGFGETLKFPSAPQLAFLIAAYRQSPDDELKDFLITTLDQMASQGLYDHIGGGFFRYTTDPDWQTPHFEKMLYDNAQLASVYLEAATVLTRPDYRDVALETLAFMLRDMQDSSGAHIAALSAVDGNDVEGGYYLWNRDELQDVLDADGYRAVDAAWLGSNAAPFEQGYLPLWQAGSDAMFTTGSDASPNRDHLEAARMRLLGVRSSTREVPVDEKLLAGWNGLALSAFARAARDTGDALLREGAQAIQAYLLGKLWDGKRLLRASAGNQALGQSTLGDYAAVAAGLLDYYYLSNSENDLAAAEAVALAAWQAYSSAAGWRYGVDGLLPASSAEGVIMDGALFSPSASLLATSCKLLDEGRASELRSRVVQVAGWDVKAVRLDSFWYASQVAALNGACRDILVGQ